MEECSYGTRSGANRVAAEEGGKTVSQGRRPLDLRKVRGARENQPLSTRQMREHPPMKL